jgi:hypothetical protein
VFNVFKLPFCIHKKMWMGLFVPLLHCRRYCNRSKKLPIGWGCCILQWTQPGIGLAEMLLPSKHLRWEQRSSVLQQHTSLCACHHAWHWQTYNFNNGRMESRTDSHMKDGPTIWIGWCRQRCNQAWHQCSWRQSECRSEHCQIWNNP